MCDCCPYPRLLQACTTERVPQSSIRAPDARHILEVPLVITTSTRLRLVDRVCCAHVREPVCSAAFGESRFAVVHDSGWIRQPAARDYRDAGESFVRQLLWRSAAGKGSPYHNGNGSCPSWDHACVNGLLRTRNAQGAYTCKNSNLDIPCTRYVDPSNYVTYYCFPVRPEQPPSSIATITAPLPTKTTGGKVLIYFCSALGPAFPNRSYLMAATSFGHLTTKEELAPMTLQNNTYKPVTGTIFDLLNQQGIIWTDYFTDAPQAGSFRNPVPPRQTLPLKIREELDDGSEMRWIP